MRIRIEVETNIGADVTIERGHFEHSQSGGPEVNLKVLDALLSTATREVRLAYGIDTDTADKNAANVTAVDTKWIPTRWIPTNFAAPTDEGHTK